ncbi:antitoxin MazE-like protein [Fundidesulfovibrio soli]
MRLVEIWVPDTSDPTIAEEFRRQLALAREGDGEGGCD